MPRVEETSAPASLMALQNSAARQRRWGCSRRSVVATDMISSQGHRFKEAPRRGRLCLCVRCGAVERLDGRIVTETTFCSRDPNDTLRNRRKESVALDRDSASLLSSLSTVADVVFIAYTYNSVCLLSQRLSYGNTGEHEVQDQPSLSVACLSMFCRFHNRATVSNERPIHGRPGSVQEELGEEGGAKTLELAVTMVVSERESKTRSLWVGPVAARWDCENIDSFVMSMDV